MSWTWLEIAKLAVPVLVTAAVSILIWCLSNVATQRLWDINLLEKFKDTHFASDKRVSRLSPYLVNQMKAPALRQGLRKFIFWDIMEHNFAKQVTLRTFDPDHHDWHLLGEAMANFKTESGKEDLCWLTEMKGKVFERWPQHSSEITAVYAYLDKHYLNGEWNNLPPCTLFSSKRVRGSIRAIFSLILP